MKALIVDDDRVLADVLAFTLRREGFQIILAYDGETALECWAEEQPDLIVLDVNMPRLDGFAVCRRIREQADTPIILLTVRGEEDDIVHGLKLGADDYITKPFDLQLLMLRVEGALRRAGWLSLTSPVTGLPSSKLIEEQLRKIMRRKGWSVLYVGINHISDFNDVYGFVAGDDVLRFTAMLLAEVVDEFGAGSEFIGHVGGDDFIIIGTPEAASQLGSRMTQRFNEEVETFYNYKDRERGYIEVDDGAGKVQKVPLMSLAVGLIHHDTAPFADIREITEVAAEARRRSQQA
jgi:diguanylate cyclase (GGDEF)-like protein